MRILVAGGTGLIGHRFVEMSVAAGHDVHAVVRRADHALPCPVTLTQHPLDAALYGRVAAETGTDVMVNLLAAGVEPSDRSMERLLSANAVFPARLASCLAYSGVRAMVHLGSSAEYAAQPSSEPIRETAPLERERLYGATKAAGSILLQAAAHAAGLPVLVLRPFNIFGAGEKPHRLFPTVARRLRRGKPVELSDGSQVRDFLWVDDACETILSAAAALLEGGMESGEYNLASGKPVSVRDFALTLARVAGADEALLHFGTVPMRPDDLPYVVADTAKLDGAVGVADRTGLEPALAAALRGMSQQGLC